MKDGIICNVVFAVNLSAGFDASLTGLSASL